MTTNLRTDTLLCWDMLVDLCVQKRLTPRRAEYLKSYVRTFEQYLGRQAVLSDLTDATLDAFAEHFQREGYKEVTLKHYRQFLERLRRHATKDLRRQLISCRKKRVTDGPTVAQLAELYLRFAATYYVKNGEETTEVRMIRDVLAVVAEHYGSTPAANFGPKSLKLCREELIIVHDWCRTHINRQIERVKRAFKWAASEELVPGSVYESLRCVGGLRFGRTGARESHKVKPIDDLAVDATLPYLSDVVADMVRLQRVTGMRPSEVCILRPMDVDRSGDVWQYTPESHKTQHHGKVRSIFIGPEGQKILTKYLDRSVDCYCFDPAETDELRRSKLSRILKSAFGTDGGEAKEARARRRMATKQFAPKYNVRTYGFAVRRAAARAGCEKWSPNRLRHSFATKVRKQFGLEASQVLLGHATADVTQVYAERDEALAARVVKKVG